MNQTIAVYLRVSTKSQDVASQEPELRRWAAQQDGEVRWYRDRFTGKTMERPAFTRLLRHVRTGEVQQIAVWRLDRLGRTAKGLTALFDELTELNVRLVSLRDGLDLSTACGRLRNRGPCGADSGRSGGSPCQGEDMGRIAEGTTDQGQRRTDSAHPSDEGRGR
jgi:hypothetical protein